MLATVVHENMKLGDNTLNNETCKHENKETKKRIVAQILPPYKLSIISRLESQIKRRSISRISIFFIKHLSSGFKIIRLFVKIDQNVYKTASKRGDAAPVWKIVFD